METMSNQTSSTSQFATLILDSGEPYYVRPNHVLEVVPSGKPAVSAVVPSTGRNLVQGDTTSVLKALAEAFTLPPKAEPSDQPHD